MGNASARDWDPIIGKRFNPLEMVNTHTYLVFASLVGMNGATIVITQRSSPSTRKYLDGYLALQREMAMRWPNGCLR